VQIFYPSLLAFFCGDDLLPVTDRESKETHFGLVSLRMGKMPGGGCQRYVLFPFSGRPPSSRNLIVFFVFFLFTPEQLSLGEVICLGEGDGVVHPLFTLSFPQIVDPYLAMTFFTSPTINID